MMVKQLLDQAKAFLCWDTFPDLTIKLIPQSIRQRFIHRPHPTGIPLRFSIRFLAMISGRSCFSCFMKSAIIVNFRPCIIAARTHVSGNVNMANGREKVAFEEESWELGK